VISEGNSLFYNVANFGNPHIFFSKANFQGEYVGISSYRVLYINKYGGI